MITWMLPLLNINFDDVLGQWRLRAMTLHQNLSLIHAGSEFQIKSANSRGYKQLIKQNIYNYIIQG